MKRILVVDDDRIQHQIVLRILANEGVAVDCAADLSSARRYLSQARYEAIILDLSLREENGLDLLRRYGQVTVEVATLGHRSSFIGAVLATREGVQVEEPQCASVKRNPSRASRSMFGVAIRVAP